MRLVTRSDFDGLVCAVLLVEKGVIDDFIFAHPKDVQDGAVAVTANDVLTNVPYVPGCGLWFDHHASEHDRLGDVEFEGASCAAPSAAQVVWDYYGGLNTFRGELVPLLEAVNKSDSGNLTRDELVEPAGWLLLSFIMDPRTGLGRFSDYRIGNQQLMRDLIEYCRTMGPDEIIALPDVKERVDRYFDEQFRFKEMLIDHAKVLGNLVVVDLRPCDVIHCGNRFLVYALYDQQNIELRVMWGKDKQRVVFACGHSILNRTCTINVGRLMLEYGGGGHERVGSCQVPADQADRVLAELTQRITAGG